jgi:hypothetical protein
MPILLSGSQRPYQPRSVLEAPERHRQEDYHVAHASCGRPDLKDSNHVFIEGLLNIPFHLLCEAILSLRHSFCRCHLSLALLFVPLFVSFPPLTLRLSNFKNDTNTNLQLARTVVQQVLTVFRLTHNRTS